MLLIHSPNTMEPALGQAPFSEQATLLDKTQTLSAQSWWSRMDKTSEQAIRIKCGRCDGRGSTGSFCSWREGHWTWAELGEASQQDHWSPHGTISWISKARCLSSKHLTTNCWKIVIRICKSVISMLWRIPGMCSVQPAQPCEAPASRGNPISAETPRLRVS